MSEVSQLSGSSKIGRSDREAVIIGYGVEYLLMALNCARSLRESNPG